MISVHLNLPHSQASPVATGIGGRMFPEYQYWLHSIFIGHLWVSGRFNPGASDVCIGWREQLENDVAPLIEQGILVWARMDNAYYTKRWLNGSSRSNGTSLSV